MFFKNLKNFFNDLFRRKSPAYYDAASHSEDYMANMYSMRFFRVMTITSVIVWILNILNIFIIDQTIMNNGVLAVVTLHCIALLISRYIGFDKPVCKYVYLTLIILIVTIVNVFLTYHGILTIMFPIIFSSQYMDRKVRSYVLALTIVCINLATVLGYFIGLCDANIAMLTVSTLTRETPVFLSGVENVNTDAFLIFLYYGVPRSMLLLATSPLVNHIADEIRDKTLREAEQKRMADMDSLSGQLNKNAFLIASYRKYSDGSFPCAFLFIDMDHFKNLNDRLGHQVGDQAIVDVSRSVKEAFRQNDLIGRYGGDEFIAFIDNISKDTLRDRLRPMLKNLRKSYSFDGITCDITGSIGAVYFSCDIGKPFDNVLELADKQVYRAKESGRDRISLQCFGEDPENFTEEFIFCEE